MTLKTTRFGEIEYSSDDTLTIEGGILGFPQYSTYLVLQHREGSPFRWLQSAEKPDLAFLVTDPENFVSNYAPEVDNSTADELALNEATPRILYAIATIPKGRPEEMTINLAGPIVINASTRRARQLVIEDPSCSIRHPLVLDAVHNRESAAA